MRVAHISLYLYTKSQIRVSRLAAREHDFGYHVPGSYRQPKVLNVLEFYDLIRVPLNVLEFVLNVLEIL